MTVLDDVYNERNRCVAMIAKLAEHMDWRAGIGRHKGEDWEDDWRNVVYIDLPTGQVSWHIHDSDLHLFAFLDAYLDTWDGHTTDEKYQRLYDYTHTYAQE